MAIREIEEMIARGEKIPYMLALMLGEEELYERESKEFVVEEEDGPINPTPE